MKTNLTTILLTALATLGVISLTSGNLSSATQQGNYRGTTYLSKDSKTLQISHTMMATSTWETAFSVPMDGNGSTWEVTDWWGTLEENDSLGNPYGWSFEQNTYFARVKRSNGSLEPFSGSNYGKVHHRGIILHEGDSLEFLTHWYLSTKNVHVFASGKFIN